ncbi:Signal transduction histidine kinase [Peptoclostridium litorale DSM 5388]|uniref:histidine kinase n=1 Tax=Peptoclostridium litorale DSM 5388 TaxID=1121324 RepID=A0A069RLS2_PEPLI|nr:HAMP domain-containing sensor histidine kinase [Peptoclostridium litorale]KDR95117.1 Two-component system signal transduction histidine kinase [Peptoclostridium litorale DSM 5388]SIN74743.1 Signal transduction histidine kinase [Peptoclostridium litorale DSM 5388]
MDTKWKNIRYNKFLKSMVFAMAVIFLTGGLSLTIYLMDNADEYIEAAFEKSYMESSSLKYKLDTVTENVIALLKNYKSEDFIKSGGSLNSDAKNYYDRYSYSHDLRRLFETFKSRESESIDYDDEYSEIRLMEKFESEHSKEVEYYKTKAIDDELKDYNNLINKLQRIDGLYYYTSSSESYSHIKSPESSKDFFESQPVSLIFDSNGISVSSSIKNANVESWENYLLSELNSASDTLYIALGDEFIGPESEKWSKSKKILIPNLYMLLSLALGFMACLSYIVYAAGRVELDDKIQMIATDRLYVDVSIAFSLFAATGLSFIAGDTFNTFRYFSFVPCALAVSIIAVSLVSSVARHFKNKTLLSHTVFHKLFHSISLFFRRLLNSLPLSVKMMPTPARASDLNEILSGIDRIKSGELDYKICTLTHGVYRDMAEGINSIADGLSAAVSNELKSERMKTELISNVSHDIRTPLTSIITYVDLLKNEGLDSKEAPKYLQVLDQKSTRLKNLTDDLFEASKASSGNMPVNLEKVEIISLLKQGMGELDDKISASGLQFKLGHTQDKVYAKADGKLIWRVIENLMSNIFKYALRNSRVYIDIAENEHSVQIVMKNISSYELNTDASELMERFKRADESRSSEGSGLGLSISQGLMSVQGGDFKVEIDGDLFKSIMTIPKYK